MDMWHIIFIGLGCALFLWGRSQRVDPPSKTSFSFFGINLGGTLSQNQHNNYAPKEAAPQEPAPQKKVTWQEKLGAFTAVVSLAAAVIDLLAKK